MPDIEREIQVDFYRKLLDRLESIQETIDEGLGEINQTLQRFGNYMPEQTNPTYNDSRLDRIE